MKKEKENKRLLQLWLKVPRAYKKIVMEILWIIGWGTALFTACKLFFNK